MKRWPWRWPWRRRHHAEGNGHVAAAARASAEAALRKQVGKWPEVRQARDVLAELAERAMRGTP